MLVTDTAVACCLTWAHTHNGAFSWEFRVVDDRDPNQSKTVVRARVYVLYSYFILVKVNSLCV